MWVYLLRSKDEALAKFKIFKAQVEMETAHKVKVLRTDRGGGKGHYSIRRLEEKKTKPGILKNIQLFGVCKKVGGHLTKLEDRSMLMVHLGIGGGSSMAEQSPSSSSGSVSVNDTVPFDTFDDTLVRGTRLLQEIYERKPMMTEEEVQDKYQQAGLLLLNEEPTSFHEATKDIQWMEAMQAEIDSIEKNRTWTLTRLPPNQKVIALKWVYKLKRDASGMVTKHKARLMAAMATACQALWLRNMDGWQTTVLALNRMFDGLLIRWVKNHHCQVSGQWKKDCARLKKHANPAAKDQHNGKNIVGDEA
nr:zinc finger, CCHC-type [Tanacetum cinerariifolium]